MSKLATLILRHTTLILFMSILLSIWGGFYTYRLYGNLRTDLEELLPTSSRSVKDLGEVARRLTSIDNLAVLVFSKDTQASKRFILDLAAKLESFPREEVAGIEYRIDRELDFFRKRQMLYMDRGDLVRIRDYVHQRIQYETSLYNPLTIFSSEQVAEPELDFRSLKDKYESREKDYSRFPGGFFATPDETKRALLIDAAGKALGINGIKQLKNHVSQTIELLRPHSYASDLEVHYTGSVEETLEEQDALVEDLLVSTIAVLVLVSAVMLLFFRLFWPTFALLFSLLGGTLWTFGLSYFAVGYLNANSAFLGSIVLGNGINFGVILLARYIEERRLGHVHIRACHIAISTTWKATLTAALAAGFSYGSLMLTSFRGFNQFGVIGLIGMGTCWACTYTFLPALLTFTEKIFPVRSHSLRVRRTPFSSIAATVVSRYPGFIVATTLVLTLLSVVSLTRVNSGLLETNLKNLRSKRSTETGAAHYNLDLDQIFQRFLTPIVILPASHKNALEIASRLKTLKRERGGSSEIVSVQTIDDFVPREQREKIDLLKDIHSLLTPSVVRRLGPEDQAKTQDLLSKEALNELQSLDLPPLIRQKFTEKDGSLGKLVVVEPPITDDIWAGQNLERFIGELRSIADSVQPGAPVAGGMAITSDLVSSISHDGPRATLLALISVVVLVILIFRDFRICIPSLVALLLGVTWFGGLIVSFASSGLKVNFLNFVAMPITFGIGVDYGVNVFQRYRQQADRDIARVIRETGGAVGLCSLTTIIGYSSLLMASNRGFVSFGLLAVLGELTCVSAAILSLPAMLVLWQNLLSHRKLSKNASLVSDQET